MKVIKLNNRFVQLPRRGRNTRIILHALHADEQLCKASAKGRIIIKCSVFDFFSYLAFDTDLIENAPYLTFTTGQNGIYIYSFTYPMTYDIALC